MDGERSATFRHEVLRVFTMLDRDGDHLVDVEELKVVWGSGAALVAHALDQDEDSSLSLEEWTNFWDGVAADQARNSSLRYLSLLICVWPVYLHTVVTSSCLCQLLAGCRSLCSTNTDVHAVRSSLICPQCLVLSCVRCLCLVMFAVSVWSWLLSLFDTVSYASILLLPHTHKTSHAHSLILSLPLL